MSGKRAMENEAPWQAAKYAGDSASNERLTKDLHVDVCVVGAGIAGITTAYMLARERRSVAVLDHGPVGGGETGRTTAHLSNAVDDRFAQIERLHGPGGSEICAESHTAAIDSIERIINVEGIDCDFKRVDGYLFHSGDVPVVDLDEELESARRAGIQGVEMLSRPPIDYDTGPCLRFPRQGQFEPLKYLRALAQAIRREGGRVYCDAHVDEISPGERAGVSIAHGPTVTADAVVVATNSPVSSRFAIHTKQAPYRTYAIAARIPRGAVPQALYWDTLDPYHYVRLVRDDLLIVGGEDRKTGSGEDNEERFLDIERWARTRFPMMDDIAFRWSGQVLEPVDGIAFIGRAPDGDSNLYIASGDSGMGMTHGTIAGMLITDLIMGRGNPWADLYDPARKTLGAMGRFLREALGTAAGLADWLKSGEVDSEDEIPVGEGRILRRGLTKLAVYRDREGALHERSAACTHLGCVVAWNSIAGSWDCPCHGSRFDPHGRVLNGPAITGLRSMH